MLEPGVKGSENVRQCLSKALPNNANQLWIQFVSRVAACQDSLWPHPLGCHLFGFQEKRGRYRLRSDWLAAKVALFAGEEPFRPGRRVRRFLRPFQDSLEDIRSQRFVHVAHLQQMSLRSLPHHCIVHGTGVPDKSVVPLLQNARMVEFSSRGDDRNVQNLAPTGMFRVGQYDAHMTFVWIVVCAKQE